MAEVELGTFLAFLAVPALTLVFMSKIRSWQVTGYILFLGLGALSFIMLGGIALMFYFDYDVVISENTIIKDAMGVTTGTETTTTPVINSFQDIWALIFSAFAFVFGGIYFWVMIKGGT